MATTTELEEFLIRFRDERAEDLIRYAGWAMLAALGILDTRWPSGGLARHFNAHGPAMRTLLESQPAFASLTRALHARYRLYLADPEVWNDPTVMQDLAVYTAHLFDELPRALPAPAQQQAADTLRELLPRIASDLIQLAEPQVDRLVTLTTDVMRFIERRVRDGGRTIIVELPIGNSIPSKLLVRRMTARNLRNTTGRIALTRNDNERVGVTRRTLLDKVLRGANLSQNDLVVLVDEWFTGVNFHAVAGHIADLVRPTGALFLPVAMLRNDSSTNRQYASFAAAHDALAAALGERGSDWRYVFPPLDTDAVRGGYLLWSEHDRLAGYRKFPVVGTFVNSINEAINRIRTDMDVRRGARFELLGMMAQQRQTGAEVPQVTPAALIDGGLVDRLFDESYVDYVECRDAIARLEHAPTDGGTEELAEDIAEFVERVFPTISGRPAAICVRLAQSYISSEGILDTDDSYRLDANAPSLAEIGGGFRLLHEGVMDALIARANR